MHSLKGIDLDIIKWKFKSDYKSGFYDIKYFLVLFEFKEVVVSWLLRISFSSDEGIYVVF